MERSPDERHNKRAHRESIEMVLHSPRSLSIKERVNIGEHTVKTVPLW